MKTKKDPRHQARRKALLAIFEWSFHNNSTLSERDQSILAHLEPDDAEKVSDYDAKLHDAIINGLQPFIGEIDALVQECAPEWPLNQISRIDLAILRLAVFEVLHYPQTPTKVAIDEAVELAKEFGGSNSSKFVNGVLGTVVKKYLPDTPPVTKETETLVTPTTDENLS